MFRNLRARRRPRYGAYVCAVISALLLLLSVSLLYSRLSLSHSRDSHHLFQKPNSLTDFLISDSEDDNDVVFGTTASSEDKIDELDIVEEDASFRVSNDGELAEDEEQSDQMKVSGFYFDHVTRAIRRAFDDKRSIDDWGDDSLAFTVGLGVGDPSIVAFGSDDFPVDEDVRRKASEAIGIEDALLLKMEKKVNPLREGWGNWFDKKGDFLRRDRMFKSNLEILNPLNNPILQDPDGLGVTGLTRGDKIMQKWWMNELKKPFLSKKTLRGVSGKDDQLKSEKDDVDARIKKGADVDFVNVLKSAGEMTSKIKRTDRRTLDENVSTEDGNIMRRTLDEADAKSFFREKIINLGEALNRHGSTETDWNSFHHTAERNGKQEKRRKQINRKQNGTVNVSSNAQVKSEFMGHLYADGKRWGYYPGLRPHLSFSNFMNAFFTKGRCKLRVFMVWNSPPWMFNVRHQRGLESLLFHHQDACVVVLSETIELDFFKDNLLKDGYKIAVAMPNLDELLKNTPARIFASVWFEWRKAKFYSIHYSELVRLAALYKYGGIYLDSDIIVLKPMALLDNFIGMENELAGSSLNGAVMSFRRNSPFLMDCMKEFYKSYDETRRRWNGADLLTRVAKRFSSKMDTSKKLKLKALPSFIFFPISSQNITRYFSAPAMESEKAEEDALFKKILNESSTFHFWNGLTYSLIPEQESLVARLINHFCLRCSDVM